MSRATGDIVMGTWHVAALLVAPLKSVERSSVEPLATSERS